MRRNGVWYWVTTVAVVAFGIVSIFSIGWLFLTAGMAMAVAGLTGWATSRPTIFWPVVAAIAAFFVGYIAVAPLSCHASATSGESVESVEGITECASVLGISYEGAGDYNPSLWPGVATGVAVAAAAGATARILTARRQRP